MYEVECVPIREVVGYPRSLAAGKDWSHSVVHTPALEGVVAAIAGVEKTREAGVLML